MPFLTQGNTNWKFIAVVAVLAIIIGGGILSYLQLTEKEFKISPADILEKVIEDEFVDWLTYRNDDYGFEIKYPQNLTAKDWAFKVQNRDLLVYIGKNKDIGDGPLSIEIEKGVDTFEQKSFFPFEVQTEDLENVLIGEEDYSAKKFSYKGPAHELSEEANFVEYFIEQSGYLYQIHWNRWLLPENIFNQMLSTFRFIEDEMEILSWEPICDLHIKKPFTVEVKEGEGLTHAVRKGITEYMNSLNIVNMGKEAYSLNPEEAILAEDYISKNLGTSESLTIGQEVKIPCPLVESTLLAVRELVTEKLTEEQIDNLKTHGRSVISIEMLRAIQEIIDKTTLEDGLQPIIIPIGN